jgi:hypothetical protein
MSLQTRIQALYAAIAAAINDDRNARGALSSLTTADKSSIVAAINEVLGVAESAQNAVNGLINDEAPSASHAFSSQKVTDLLVALKDEILGGASGAFDTLKELEDALADADVTGLLSAIGNRVRFDAAQTLDSTQQATARTNIGAASAADLTALSDAIGDTDTDFAAAFTALLV